jgi:uncharacterized integral membrane protein
MSRLDVGSNRHSWHLPGVALLLLLLLLLFGCAATRQVSKCFFAMAGTPTWIY